MKVRTVVTDDVASAPRTECAQRRASRKSFIFGRRGGLRPLAPSTNAAHRPQGQAYAHDGRRWACSLPATRPNFQIGADEMEIMGIHATGHGKIGTADPLPTKSRLILSDMAIAGDCVAVLVNSFQRR
jgi:dihydroxyacetone kinase